MKSIMKKNLLSSVMAAALATGVGFSGSAQAIHLAEDGIGQVLMGPMYMANYRETGYDTYLTVVNTRTDVAVKAKVVLRSATNSTEVLDFILYLTPGDVWRGRIYQDGFYTESDAEVAANSSLLGKPKVVLYSDDDSIKSPVTSSETYPTICASGCTYTSPDGARATFGSIKPVKVNLFTDRIINGLNAGTETLQLGHIEVIGVYGARGTVRVTESESVVVERGMSKFSVAKIFDTSRATLNSLNGREVIAVTRDESGNLIDVNGALYPNANSGNIRSSDPTWVRLTGDVSLRIGTADRMGYPFYALAGEVWDNVPYTDRIRYTTADGFGTIRAGFVREPVAVSTNLGYYGTTTRPYLFDGRVLANPDFDAIGGLNAPETAIAFNFGVDLVRDVSMDNLLEIEHALATRNLYGSYEATSTEQTSVMVTFPTRYRHRVNVGATNLAIDEFNNPCAVAINGESSVASSERVYSPPFRWSGIISPSVSSYNNFEQLIVTTEGSVFSGGVAAVETFINLVEVNYVIVPWAFESGWFDMSFNPVSNASANNGYIAGCNYNGVPALGLSHKYFITSTGIGSSLVTPLAHSPEMENRQWP